MYKETRFLGENGFLNSAQDAQVRIPLARMILIALLLIGTLARLAPLAANRFHQDEAIYSYWGRLIASGRDPLLLTYPVDKPPLLPYLLALTFRVFRVSEVSARLPGVAASVLTTALTYSLARRVYGTGPALVAMVFMALSPFNILFAPTAFTDPLMVMWVVAALRCAVEGRWFWAGAFLGLAMATKQQGALFAPLIVAGGWAVMHDAQCTIHKVGWPIGLLGFALPMMMVTLWDAQRWSVQPSYFEQGLTSYGTLRLAPCAEWGRRCSEWLGWLRYITASPVLNLTLLVGVPLLLWISWREMRTSPAVRFDFVLSGFVALYLLAHWLWTFNVWDRYLLGLVPLLAMLLGRVMWGVGRVDNPAYGIAVVALVVILLARPAWLAAHSGYPVGGDHWAYVGIDAVADYLRAEMPPGSVLYHRYLGWHYLFYLFDAPVNLRWYNSPSRLAEDAQQMGDVPRYVVLPSWEPRLPVQAALRHVGLDLHPLFRTVRTDGTVSFTVYRIE
ncbi:MAG: glycosyltransferase family 39 protein [Anaerolineae bacterium]|jgi:4-amino-4-deoxy-L-arabinose transferase-like glycosyltransferase|nr:glycosyltransferase family 39 protein [Anaerolineae bacterium]MDH7473970.1 glycosyltransferase family 39 protein [Anaerolineae bacterium]